MGEYDPWAHAEKLHVPVYRQQLRTRPGFWLPDQHAIIIRSGMRPFEERSVLAHELVHVKWNDTCNTPRAEHRANRVAAQRLIDPRALATLSRIYTEPSEAWCHELGATPELILAALEAS